MRPLTAALVVLLLASPACAATQAVVRSVPRAPVAVQDIVYARPFTLQKSYRYDWSKERSLVATGVLVVLAVDPALVVPTDDLEPVLYAGNIAVQRLNHGYPSGRVIAIVPGPVDLSTVPIWFGAPDLPERVTAAVARTERARAEQAGVRPFSAEKIAGVQRPAVAAVDLAALLRDVAAELIDQYAPQEKELADAWRLPTAKAPPKRQKP